MDSSVAIAAAYLQLNGFFVLTELPVQAGDTRACSARSQHCSRADKAGGVKRDGVGLALRNLTRDPFCSRGCRDEFLAAPVSLLPRCGGLRSS